jgi:hypothetical protein
MKFSVFGMKVFHEIVPSFLFFFFFNFTFAQSFHRTYGTSDNETGTCIQSTPDGNFIISTRNATGFNGNGDFGLLKVSTAGNIIWSKNYGGTDTEKNSYVSVCTDGGFIMTGYTLQVGTNNFSDLFLVRTDSDGNLSWSESIGGSKDDQGWYVTQTNDGGFISVGSTKSFNGSGNWDGYMVKVNSAGAMQWEKIMGGTGSDYFLGMSKTNDGGYIIAGETLTKSFGSSDIWLVKTNSAGDSLWTRQYGKTTEDAGNTVIQTADGGYIVAGDMHVNPNAGDHNACLLKTDSDGTMQWAKQYGSSPGSEIGWDVRQATDKGYYLLGSSNAYGNGGGDFMLVRTNSSGNLVWAKAYGGSLLDDVWYFQKAAKEGNMIVGASQSYGAGQTDVYLVGTDSMGNSECYTTPIVPYVNTPVLQVRSGTSILTGISTVNLLTTISSVPSTSSFDPCSVVSVSEIEDAKPDVSISPNPFTGSAIISINFPIVQNLELRIYDLTGNCIYKQTIYTQTSTLDVQAAKGMYFYKVCSTRSTIFTGKIILE